MRLDDTFRIGETVTKLLMYGPVAREISGYSQLLRCITARGSSVGLSRANPTKVETNKYSYMLEYKCKRPDHVLAVFSTAKFVGNCFKMVQNQQTLLHDKSFQKFWLRKLTKLCKVLKCYFISFQ